MKREIKQSTFLGLIALTLALLLCPALDQLVEVDTGTAFGGQSAFSDGNSGSGKTDNEGHGFGHRPQPRPRSFSVQEPATLLSLILGTAGVVLFLRWRKKGSSQ